MDARPSGAVTFVLTDVDGSTALLGGLGRAGYGALLERYRALVGGALADAGGALVDREGDGLFYAFARAVDAVAGAVAAQRAVRDAAWPEAVEVRVRIGAHTGEVEPRDGRYVGLAVHRAQRVCGAGHGGQILLSETTASFVEDMLPPGTALADLGEHRLRGLPRPERLAEVRLDGYTPPPAEAGDAAGADGGTPAWLWPAAVAAVLAGVPIVSMLLSR